MPERVQGGRGEIRFSGPGGEDWQRGGCAYRKTARLVQHVPDESTVRILCKEGNAIPNATQGRVQDDSGNRSDHVERRCEVSWAGRVSYLRRQKVLTAGTLRIRRDAN